MTATICYPAGTNWSCAFSEQELAEMWAIPDTAAVMRRSEALAWSTLAGLTAYQIGVCPTVIRPCRVGCGAPGTYPVATPYGGGHYSSLPLVSIGAFTPNINADGVWVNSCGCGSAADCSCTALCEAILPGPVGSIEEVKVDGVVLPATAYRVDNGARLVRTDGECWPDCQDFSTNDPNVGFRVTYYRGASPNELTKYAAGVLAVEFFKACSGHDCRLPAGVSTISRQGITMEIGIGMFTSGLTGIREVDAVIGMYNPNGLKAPPHISSPDVRPGRIATYGG